MTKEKFNLKYYMDNNNTLKIIINDNNQLYFYDYRQNVDFLMDIDYFLQLANDLKSVINKNNNE